MVFRDDVGDVPGLARRLAAGQGGQVDYVYGAAIRGFSVRLGNAQAAEAIARNPNVAFVEADQVMRIDASQTPAPWGLDRTDDRTLILDNEFTFTSTGSGVTAYIIDTGILTGHVDFGGRARRGFDAISPAADDCNGHGTHVAGTAGGATYGVAKSVTLVAVRVLDCSGSGSTSGVIAGVDYVAAQSARPAVANMSLGGGSSTALDNAVATAINSGVSFAVAAGNSRRDACNFSPARVPGALTVGATTNTDVRASFSNFGRCLDLFAPGSSITSAWYTSPTATATISGTSMASPHVAGVVAQFLQLNPNATVSAVTQALIANSTLNTVGDAGRSSPNRLLYSNY